MNKRESYKNTIEELTADGHFAGVEADREEVVQPFDPEKISIDSKVVPMDTLLRRLRQRTIRLCRRFNEITYGIGKEKADLLNL